LLTIVENTNYDMLEYVLDSLVFLLYQMITIWVVNINSVVTNDTLDKLEHNKFSMAQWQSFERIVITLHP